MKHFREIFLLSVLLLLLTIIWNIGCHEPLSISGNVLPHDDKKISTRSFNWDSIGSMHNLAVLGALNDIENEVEIIESIDLNFQSVFNDTLQFANVFKSGTPLHEFYLEYQCSCYTTFEFKDYAFEWAYDAVDSVYVWDHIGLNSYTLLNDALAHFSYNRLDSAIYYLDLASGSSNGQEEALITAINNIMQSSYDLWENNLPPGQSPTAFWAAVLGCAVADVGGAIWGSFSWGFDVWSKEEWSRGEDTNEMLSWAAYSAVGSSTFGRFFK